MTKEELVSGLIDLGIVSEKSKDSFQELPEPILNELYSNASKKQLTQKDVDALIKNKKIDEVTRKALSDSLEARRKATQEKNDYVSRVKSMIESINTLV